LEPPDAERQSFQARRQDLGVQTDSLETKCAAPEQARSVCINPFNRVVTLDLYKRFAVLAGAHTVEDRRRQIQILSCPTTTAVRRSADGSNCCADKPLLKALVHP
jgi:hypothetical protein